MKRNTRRQILLFLFIAGVILKKCGFGLSIVLTLSSSVLLCIEMIRSAFSKNHNRFLQTVIYSIFGIFFFISLAQLQYWIPNLAHAFEIWIAWVIFTLLFFWKAAYGKTQLSLWFILTALLSSAAFMNPRTYHNFYRASYYEDYIRRHYTEMEIGIADNYIDKFKDTEESVARALFEKGKIAQKEKDNDLALELYNAAIDRYPDDAKMYFDRGSFKLSRLELNSDVAISAIKDFDRAIKLKPDYDAAYLNRGMALSYIGRHLRACYDFHIAQSLNPKLVLGDIKKRNCERAEGKMPAE